MAGKTALVVFLGLAGGLGFPSKQPLQDASFIIESSLPMEIDNFSITEPSMRTSLQQQASEELPKLCTVCENGPESGGRRGKSEGHFWIQDDEEADGFRGERCLLTMARSQGQGLLQHVLGRDLRGMSTEERLEEFRRKVEALRRRHSFVTDQSKECDKDSKSNPVRDSHPLIVLPVSPFSSSSFEEAKLKSKEEIIEKVDEIKYPLKITTPSMSSTSGEKFPNSGQKDSINVVSPFRGRNVQGAFQKDSKKMILKSTDKNIGITDVINPHLQMIPHFIARTSGEQISNDSDQKDTGKTKVVSPFHRRNIEEAFNKDGKNIVLKGIEENIGILDKIKPPLKIISPFIDRSSGEHFQPKNEQKGAIITEENNKGVVRHVKPSSSISVSGCVADIPVVRPLRPAWCQIILPSPVQQSVQGSLESAKPSGFPGIKLPTQFLALTRIRERTVDIDKFPDEIDETYDKSKQIHQNLQPDSSINTPTTAEITPIAPLQSPPPAFDITPITNCSGETPLTDKIGQSNLPTTFFGSSSLSDYKEYSSEILEALDNDTNKQGPILEGIVAIPNYINIHN